MKRALVLHLLFLTFVCAGQGQVLVGRQPPVVRDIAPVDLEALIRTTSVLVLDCNEPDNYEWAHVPGATLIEYDRVSKDILPSDLTATLVFYCYSPECPAGAMAADAAIQLGYSNVYCMTAGIIGWQDAGLPTEP